MPPNPYEDPLQPKRQQAQSALEQMVGRGELTLAGYSDRAEIIWATDNVAELDRIIHESQTTEVESYVNPAAPTMAPQGWQVFGDVDRGGQFRLPAVTQWKSVFGNTKLDLRQALVEKRVVELNLNMIFGDFYLIVPAGTNVEWAVTTMLGNQKMVHGRGDTFGGFVNKLLGGPEGGILGREVQKVPPAQQFLVRLTGRMVFGDIKVRTLDDMETAPLT